ncbi:YceI family protein [Pontibacter virosus]|uniref:Polyisoprenoid-binding protein YceI n=1 Tax=Pontibacter virosus TaxID=1765052 RepID=A0A2U1B0U2_9BACT|nr:YceI family protein [Pontibacter virosus]PVY42304.1 polyisoprenoid-binding protein YceI [Pontibacter virosus]
MKHAAVWVLLLATISVVMAMEPMADALQQTPRISKANSSITYTLKHPLHTVQGSSKEVSSQLLISEHGKQIQQVTVSVPVRSFDSGNRARDRDMLQVTEADRYPKVAFVSSEITERNGELSVRGKLSFHGVTREIAFKARQYTQGDELLVDGSFELSLDDYQIERPSILTMKVRDRLQVQFQMVY